MCADAGWHDERNPRNLHDILHGACAITYTGCIPIYKREKWQEDHTVSSLPVCRYGYRAYWVGPLVRHEGVTLRTGAAKREDKERQGARGCKVKQQKT